MLNVDIKYNPYFVTTEMSIDGEPVSKDSKLGILTSDRLQNWIDKFFPALVDYSRESEICVHFTGTIRDFSDVKSAAENYEATHDNSRIIFETSLSEETDETRVQRLKALFEKGKMGPFKDTFNSKEMQQAFERAIDPTFEVNVIATMSSGKSTVVNALLGTELMPAKNEACTATIARIRDVDSLKFFTAQRFDHRGNAMSEEEIATKELLEKWNDDPETHIIEVKGNIPTVEQTEACTMVFVDTPGPNNSCNANHQKTTLEAIRSKPLSMVIYVLNATQLSTNDDCWLLSQVRQAMSAGGRRAQDRFIFIANKIDNFDPEKGESVKRAMENVRAYLKQNGIENPVIIPASAKLAKLLRLQRQGVALSRSERNELRGYVELFVEEPDMNMLEHCRERLNPECLRRLDKKLADAKDAENNETIAEILSGIPIVEEVLNDFLEKHAIPAKLKDAVDSFNDVLQKSKLAEKMNEQLTRSNQELTEINQKLKAFTEDAGRIAEAKAYRKSVKALKYDLSEKAKSACEALYVKSEAMIEQLQEDFSGGKVSEIEATRLLRTTFEKCQEFENELIVGLSEELKDEFYSVIDRLRKGYQDRVAKILNESFPNDTSLQDLQKAGMSMPSVEEMIEYHTRTEKVKVGTEKVKVGTEQVKVGTERVKVGTEQVKVGTERVVTGSHEESDSHWYNPFSWGRKRTVNEYGERDVYKTQDVFEERAKYELKDVIEERDVLEDRTYVNLKPIAARFVQDIRKFAMDNIENFKRQASQNVEAAKATLLDLMDQIDDRVIEIQKQLMTAQFDQKEKEILVAENEKKVAWCNQFLEELKQILAI